MSLSRGALVLLSLMVSVSLGAVPVEVSAGPDTDRDPSLFQDLDGSFHVLFSRLVQRQGNKSDWDIFLSTAPTLDDAINGNWGTPEPLPGANAADADETLPQLAQVRDTLYAAFFTTSRTGTDQIFVSTRSALGGPWSQAATLPLPEPRGTAVRAPSAVRGEGLLYMAYEVDGPNGPEVHLSWAEGTVITWEGPSVVAVGAKHPTVTYLPDGQLMVVYEDVASGTLHTVTTMAGQISGWGDPSEVAIPEGRQPVVIPHWDTRPTVYAAGMDPRGYWSIQRSFQNPGGAWQPSESLELVLGPLNGGNPSPLVVEEGMLCVAADVALTQADPPEDGDILFACFTDYSCTEAPNFGGATAVFDVDSCSVSGLLLEWEPPVHYGSSTLPGARYYVYRDTNIFFTPTDPYAGPVDTTFFFDTEVESGEFYYYVVRAENLEECPVGTGPLGGMIDSNLRKLSGVDLPPTAPPSVSTLRMEKSAVESGLVLTWAEVNNASNYKVYRYDGSRLDPAGFQFVATVEGTGLGGSAVMDQGSERLSFFTIRPVSPCGLEGD